MSEAAGTRMYREAAAAPEAVREQLLANATRIERLAQRLRATPPRALVTCARGACRTYSCEQIRTRA